MHALTIGKLAKRAGVGVETIRFYERLGLLESSERRDSGYRLYSEEGLRRLRFIRRAKELGFTLKEIKELLDLRTSALSEEQCEEVRTLAERKIADIRERIVTLQRMEAVLLRLVDSCCRREPTQECPILEAIQETPEQREENSYATS
ncbi:MAG: heavy metal-responsive transcriptional regulator [Armatimonadota bacterium]|nr:MAG: heavy metal-responsive transcriptional regulator [Armatimonadota bacterium]